MLGGKGKAWPDTEVVVTIELEKLPKRVLRQYAGIIPHGETLYLCFGMYRNKLPDPYKLSEVLAEEF
jgi:hypothetical protein